MGTVAKALANLIAVGFVSFAHAGSDPASFSQVPGLFLGIGSQNKAYLAAGHSSQYIQEIKKVCDNKGPLWAFGARSTFRCIGFKRSEVGDYDSAYSLFIKPEQKISKRAPVLLYSIKEFPAYEWRSRSATAHEVEDVSALFTGSKAKLKAVSKAIPSGKAIVIDANGKDATVYIMPWKVVNDGPLDETNQYYLVATRAENRYSASGDFHGKIIGFVDVNDDGLPEVRVSTDCDGICESVISVTPRVREVVSISVH